MFTPYALLFVGPILRLTGLRSAHVDALQLRHGPPGFLLVSTPGRQAGQRGERRDAPVEGPLRRQPAAVSRPDRETV